MIYANKRQGESNERLINRFKQVVQRSRVLFKCKRERYHQSPPSESFRRSAAVMRAKHRVKRAKEKFSH